MSSSRDQELAGWLFARIGPAIIFVAGSIAAVMILLRKMGLL